MKTRANSSIPILILLTIVMTCLAGCTDKAAQPPVINNLVYALLKAPMEEGKTANVTGTFDITRQTGETASINTIVYDSQRKQVSANATPLTDASLRTSDTLGFLVEISIAGKGDYTFHVYITDNKGWQSNHLIGTFSVTDVF